MRHSVKVLTSVGAALAAASTASLQSEVYSLPLDAGVTAVFTETAFIPEDHRIEWCQGNQRSPCRIDNEVPIGNFVFVPATQLQSLTLETPSGPVECDTSSIFDAFINRIVRRKPGESLRAERLGTDEFRVFGILSAEVSVFAVEWRVSKGECHRVVLDGDEAVVNSMFEALAK
jgi:hypothetical protein